MKRCRWCQREVVDEASVCPHPDCGRALDHESDVQGKIPLPPPPVGLPPAPAPLGDMPVAAPPPPPQSPGAVSAGADMPISSSPPPPPPTPPTAEPEHPPTVDHGLTGPVPSMAAGQVPDTEESAEPDRKNKKWRRWLLLLFLSTAALGIGIGYWATHGGDRPASLQAVFGPSAEPRGNGEDLSGESIGLYARRTMDDREDWIQRYGGNTLSEQAVSDGLDWLARHQADDGAWSNRCLGSKGENPDSKCEPEQPCPAEANSYEAALTGLAVLAFQAGGHDYFSRTKYTDNVRKGLDWLVDRQESDGAIVSPLPRAGHSRYHKNYMYEHGIATFALAEACAVADEAGRTPNPGYQRAVERAVRYIESQQHLDGGWKYTDHLERPGDTSVSGWQVLALKSAIGARVPPSDKCIKQIEKFFHHTRMADTGRTWYEKRNRVPPLFQTDATSGIGMLVRQFLLGQSDSRFVLTGAEYLAKHAEETWGERSVDPAGADYYLWYNCSLAMFQAGGKPWQRWNRVVRDTVVGLQQHDGCARGSWDPTSKWGVKGGRIYTTALAVLTLEVYYRYAPKSEAAESFELHLSGTEPETPELNARDEEEP